jgi:C-terminal processing protease CtpA/Prc
MRGRYLLEMRGLVLSILVVLLGPAQADSSEFRQRLFGASKELGHEQFAEREAALRRMQKLIEGERQEALECLRDLWTEEKKPEIRARLFGLASGLYLPKKNALFGFRFLPDKQLTFEGKPCLSISILEVVRNSPAEGARLQKGDLILGIGDALLAPGSSLDDILIFFKRQPLGKKRKMRVRRQEKDLIIPVLPGEQDLTKEEQRFFERKFLKWLLTEAN